MADMNMFGELGCDCLLCYSCLMTSWRVHRMPLLLLRVRKSKGLTLDQARDQMADMNTFGAFNTKTCPCPLLRVIWFG